MSKETKEQLIEMLDLAEIEAFIFASFFLGVGSIVWAWVML